MICIFSSVRRFARLKVKICIRLIGQYDHDQMVVSFIEPRL